jgi:hypothetical protein
MSFQHYIVYILITQFLDVASVLHIYLVSDVVLCFVYLCVFVLYVQCFHCLWIVHSFLVSWKWTGHLFVKRDIISDGG